MLLLWYGLPIHPPRVEPEAWIPYHPNLVFSSCLDAYSGPHVLMTLTNPHPVCWQNNVLFGE